MLPPRDLSLIPSAFFVCLPSQVTATKVCEEYQDQMNELEEILAAGPAAMNISVEQLAKQVRHVLHNRPAWVWFLTKELRRRPSGEEKDRGNTAADIETIHGTRDLNPRNADVKPPSFGWLPERISKPIFRTGA